MPKSKSVPARSRKKTANQTRANAKKVAAAPLPPDKSFPVVGIGASAGGLEAFEQFFKYMPADGGMAIVLVPHLDPSHASMMPELIRRITRMKVVEAADGVKVEPDHVYVIPPDKDMAIYHGCLQLTVPQRARGLRLPIDFFLRSLAEDQADKAICIILSGTGSDGSMGLRAVHGAGGMCMVQEAESARYEGMPKSALDTGLADYVLPVEKMPAQLISYVKKITSRKMRPLPAAPDRAPTSLQKILSILRSQTGHDFSYYKKNTIYRRIEKRMDVHDIEEISHYARYLQEHRDEIRMLFKEFLIGVTSFFRDPEAFEVLKEKIFPRFVEEKPEDYLLRVWVPGCATGEEVYSIAISFREYMEEAKQDLQLQIFGTDIDEEAIRSARNGFYPDNIAIDVGAQRLKRFFVKDEGGFRIKKEVRELVVFAVQNVIKDAPFTKLDLVSCRNLLIYLEPELQNRLIPLFHYSLRPGGILFLGSSESIGRFSDLFGTLDKKWKYFQAKEIAPAAPAVMLTGLPWTLEPSQREPRGEVKPLRRASIAELTQRVLLETFAPPALIINDKGEILYVYGQTGKYLEPSPGQASLNSLDMAREGLRFELRSAIQNAFSKKKEVRYSGLRVKNNGETILANMRVKPLSGVEGAENLLLVAFEEAAPPQEELSKKVKPVRMRPKDNRVQELEQELAYNKETLQATIEELQATNEEMRSTNEEYQSTNEELQSTNEELETSKEELQSVNEELVTVNSELQSKIDQLSRSENDMKSLLDSVSVGMIFLDPHLVIKRFTAQAVRIFNLIPTDIGRPITDIRNNLKYSSLVEDFQGVLDTLHTAEKELETEDHKWYLMRIMPSRTPENVVDGAVATFTEITKFKERERD